MAARVPIPGGSILSKMHGRRTVPGVGAEILAETG